MGIGAKLQQAINDNHTNVNELAKRANVSPSVLYSIIRRNSKSVDINILIDVANILGVPVEYFGDDYDDAIDMYRRNKEANVDSETAELALALKSNPKLAQLVLMERFLSDNQLDAMLTIVNGLWKTRDVPKLALAAFTESETNDPDTPEIPQDTKQQ